MMRQMDSTPVTARQMQRLDRRAIDDIGIPSVLLMENAGRAVTAEALRALKHKARASIAVICGMGNNAGDGFVAARHLLNCGIPVRVFLAGAPSALRDDTLLNYRIFRRLGGRVCAVGSRRRAFLRDIAHATVIIDAIFGIGVNRIVGEPFKSIIECLNDARRLVVAADVPSGLDATTGRIHGVCVRAVTTVTFGCMKTGLLENQGPQYAGRVVVADIGIPKKLVRRVTRA